MGASPGWSKGVVSVNLSLSGSSHIIIMVDECPICLGDIQEPLASQCGHVYCNECLMALIAHKNGNPVPCPLCRANVTMLLPIFSGAGDGNRAHLNEIRAFNERNSNGGNFVREDLFLVRRTYSFIFLMTGIIVLFYVISPVDLIPDWALPGLGFLDDLLVVVFFFAIWHSVASRLREQMLF